MNTSLLFHTNHLLLDLGVRLGVVQCEHTDRGLEKQSKIDLLTLDSEVHVGGVADPADGDGAGELARVLREHLGDDERTHAVTVYDLVVVRRPDFYFIAEPRDSFRRRVWSDGALQHHPLSLSDHAVV